MGKGQNDMLKISDSQKKIFSNVASFMIVQHLFENNDFAE